MAEVHNALATIQTELKAPKNMYNSFGKYKYRNFEGICEAVKPYLKKTKTILVVNDRVECINGWFYVIARAELISLEDNSVIYTEAMARECEMKKGMDAPQITGTTSSYARKYAVNGLFLLDDTKDADTDEYHEETENRAKKEKVDKKAEKEKADIDEVKQDPNAKIDKEKLNKIKALCKKEGVSESDVANSIGLEKLEDLTEVQSLVLSRTWKKVVEKLKGTKEV